MTTTAARGVLIQPDSTNAVTVNSGVRIPGLDPFSIPSAVVWAACLWFCTGQADDGWLGSNEIAGQRQIEVRSPGSIRSGSV